MVDTFSNLEGSPRSWEKLRLTTEDKIQKTLHQERL